MVLLRSFVMLVVLSSAVDVISDITVVVVRLSVVL